METIAQNDPRMLLKKLRSMDDSVSDVIDDFQYWIDNFDGIEAGLFKDREEEDKFYVTFLKLADKFLLRDEESKTRIAREEQKLLKVWTKGK